MKKLFILPLALFALATAQAQTTNVDLRITLRQPLSTNQVSQTLPQGFVQGFILAWQKDTMLALQLTNPAPSFWFSVTNEVAELIKPLRVRAEADEISTNQIPQIIQDLQNRWSVSTSVQKSNFVQAAKALGQ